MSYKVKATLGDVTKSVRLNFDATLSQAREQLGEKFGVTVTGLNLIDGNGATIPLSTDEQFSREVQNTLKTSLFVNLQVLTKEAIKPKQTQAPPPVKKEEPKKEEPKKEEPKKEEPKKEEPKKATPAPKPIPVTVKKVEVKKQEPASPSGKPKFCSECGNKLEANAKFCANCGTKVASSGAPEAKPEPKKEEPKPAPKPEPKPEPKREAPKSTDPDCCAGCGLKIKYDGLQALGQHWHKLCFVCQSCGSPLQGQFTKVDDKPCCLKCYEEKFCEKCAECGQPIMGNSVVVRGKTYHPECFCCCHCKKPINGSFGMMGDKPICNDCRSKL